MDPLEILLAIIEGRPVPKIFVIMSIAGSIATCIVIIGLGIALAMARGLI